MDRLTIGIFVGGMICSCHPLRPSNELPDAVQLELQKGEPGSHSDNEATKPKPIPEDGPQFAPENEEIGMYKGYAAISNALASRLVEPGSVFDLAFYLDGSGSSASIFPGELFKLLGSYQSDGLRSEFENGQPNGINLMVWHLALSGLGDELGLQCAVPPTTPDLTATHPPLTLRAEVKAAIKSVCGFELLSETQRGVVLDGLWRVLTGWELPEAERSAWMDWAKSPDLVTMQSTELLSALTEAALFNPHLLLRN